MDVPNRRTELVQQKAAQFTKVYRPPKTGETDELWFIADVRTIAMTMIKQKFSHLAGDL